MVGIAAARESGYHRNSVEIDDADSVDHIQQKGDCNSYSDLQYFSWLFEDVCTLSDCLR